MKITNELLTIWSLLFLIESCWSLSSGIIKLGLVYDSSTSFINAYNGYHFYAHMVNTTGGLMVGKQGNHTSYMIKIISHDINNPYDPYWTSSGSGKYIFIKFIFHQF
jgi:hypothetical protein